MTGTVEKWTDNKSVIYEIGEVVILSKLPIPALEEKVGREVVLKVEEGFPLRNTLKTEPVHHD